MARISTFGRRGAVSTLGLAILALLVASSGNQAGAVAPSPTGFSIDISPSARLLDALDMRRDGDITASQYYDIKYDESCDNPHLRIRARNKPAIMITNFDGDSVGDFASAAPITSFTLAINEGPYIFDDGDVATDNFTDFIKNTIYTDSGVTITSSVLSPDLKTLTVNFDGLTAGKKAIFNVDLDTTDPNGFLFPDYRMVLCGAPLDGEDPTTPATATATFGTAPNDGVLTINFEQAEETPEYANEDIRAYSDMDKMEVKGMEIPEPGSVALALVSVAALVSRARGRRIA